MPITALPTPPSRTDAANFSARADAFLGALPTFGTEANALAVEVNGYATNAAASAATAVNAPGTSATSTTSLAIGTGSKSLTVQTGKAFVVGQWVTITSTATPTNWMHGQITAYTSGTGALVVNVAMVGGSGTIASWTVALSAPGSRQCALPTGSAGNATRGWWRRSGRRWPMPSPPAVAAFATMCTAMAAPVASRSIARFMVAPASPAAAAGVSSVRFARAAGRPSTALPANIEKGAQVHVFVIDCTIDRDR